MQGVLVGYLATGTYHSPAAGILLGGLVLTYALVEDRVGIEKSGLWGRKEMEEWLGRDADYVVLEPRTLEQYRERHPDHMARFDALLREHFELIDRVDEYPWQVFEIYARRR